MLGFLLVVLQLIVFKVTKATNSNNSITYWIPGTNSFNNASVGDDVTGSIDPRLDRLANATPKVCPLPYSLTFIGCTKWPLSGISDFTLLTDNRLLYVPNNATYEWGEFSIAEEGRVAYVCIPEELQAHLAPLDYFYAFIWGFSLFCLLLSIGVHLWVVRALGIVDVRAIVCHKVSLVVTYGAYLVGNTKNVFHDPLARDIFSTISFFSVRATFCWLNVMAFDIWRAFHPQRMFLHTPPSRRTQATSLRHFLFQSLYAWGCPAASLTLAYLCSFLPLPVASAWQTSGPLYGNVAQMVLMRTTITAIMIANTIFCILTSYNLRKIRKDTCRYQVTTETDKQILWVFFKLMLLSGLLGFIQTIQWSVIHYGHYSLSWLLPDVLSYGHGIWIFLIYSCNASARKATRAKVRTTFAR